MSVIKLNSAWIDFKDEYIEKIKEQNHQGILYQADVDYLSNKMSSMSPSRNYVGGRNLGAKIEFSGRNPEYTMVHVAIDENNPHVTLDEDVFYAALICPVGIIRRNLTSDVHETGESLEKALYGDSESGLAMRIQSLLLNTTDTFSSVNQLIEAAIDYSPPVTTNEGAALSDSLQPSYYSLSQAFLDAGLEIPSQEELLKIFHGDQALT